jgi:hypothetical protein
MLLRSLQIPRADFEAGTGWVLKPEGACKGEVCIPLPTTVADTVDVAELATAIGLPVVEHAESGLWALGPASAGSRALTTAAAGDLALPDLEGNTFHLSSLRGQKVLVYAWAPY